MSYLDVNGSKLFYESIGDGHPIIFHHGYTASHTRWENVVNYLNTKYQCIVMDCRGTGKSEHTDNGYSFEQYSRDVISLADHLNLESFSYIGHSMGGGVGMRLGIDFPKRIEKLILVAPIPSGGIPTTYAEKRENDRRIWQEKDRTTWQIMRRTTTARILDEAAFLSDAEDVFNVSPGHFNDSWNAMADLDISKELEQIRIPTLMVAGAADTLLPANLQDFHRLGNATLHVFSRVSHGIPREVPKELSDVISDFLEHDITTARTLEMDQRQALEIAKG